MLYPLIGNCISRSQSKNKAFDSIINIRLLCIQKESDFNRMYIRFIDENNISLNKWFMSLHSTQIPGKRPFLLKKKVLKTINVNKKNYNSLTQGTKHN